MSLDDKIKHLLKINNEEICSISRIHGGWAINGLLIKEDEFLKIITKILIETPSSKKRTNILIIFKKMDLDIVNYLPNISRVILTSWHSDKKFIQNYLETLDNIIDNIPAYLDDIPDYRYLADLGSLYEIVSEFNLVITSWRKAVKLKPDFFYGWIRLSKIFMELGNTSDAILSLWNGVKNCGYDIPTGILKGKLDLKYKHNMETLVNSLQKKDKRNYMLHFINGINVSILLQ